MTFDLRSTRVNLPHLTPLRCVSIDHLDIDSLLSIASHSSDSTLDELHIDSRDNSTGDCDWVRCAMPFPSSVDEDEEQWRRLSTSLSVSGEEEGEVLAAAVTVAEDGCYCGKLTNC